MEFPSFCIPYDPRLADLVFYTQLAALDVDPVTTQPVLLPSLVARWRIGSGPFVPVSMVWDSGPTVRPTGQSLAGRAVALKLN